MVWTSTVDAVPATGIMTGRQQVAPGLYLFTGTWSAASVTAGEVDLTALGVTRISSGAFQCLTGTGITKQSINWEAGVGAADGHLAVIACTVNDSGTWWAVCEM